MRTRLRRDGVLWLLVLVAAMLLGPARERGQAESVQAGGSVAASAAFPLKVSANGRYLVGRNGVPFLIVGDVPQALTVMISTKEAASYFDDRVAHGFNSVWINVLCAGPYFPDCPVDGATYDGIRPFTGYLSGGEDTAHYDLTKPNERFFRRVDRMLDLAAERHLLVFLDPIETGQWLETLRNNGTARARSYGEFLGSRYKHFDNIIWFNGNDFRDWRNKGDDAVVQAVAEGIKSADPGALQTVEFNPPDGSSLDDPAWAPIVSVNGAYVYGPTYIQVLESYNQKPVMPTFLMEAHYDLERVGNDYGTPSVLRRQEYWTMLCGGAGQLYGNAFTWTFQSGWQSNLDTEGVAQLMIWHQFFASLPWWKLVPDEKHTVVTAGLGTYGTIKDRPSQSDYLTAASTPEGSLVIAYMPTLRTITVNMASLKAPATARWFDPTNGTYKTIPGGPLANSGSRQFTPPGKNSIGAGDWVLVLKAMMEGE